MIGKRLRRRLALLELGAVTGEDVPARASRRRRVRGDHVDPRLNQVVPPGDVLRIALADDEHHHRVTREALFWVGVPVLGNDPVLDQAGHVGRGRERHHVGGLAGVDRAALRAGGPERLAERHAIAGARLPECGGKRVVGLLRRRVGDELELSAPCTTRPGGAARRPGARRGAGRVRRATAAGESRPEPENGQQNQR